MKPDALPDDIRELLQAEKSVPPPPDAVKARVLARVETTMVASASGASIKLVLAMVAVSTVAGGVWLGVREPETAAKTPNAPSEPQTEAKIVAQTTTFAPRPDKTKQDGAVAPKPEPSKRGVSARAELAPRATPALMEQATAPLPRTLLAEERALLDASRASLQRKDAIAARVALRKHEREFASSQLEEEREVLWILVLAFEQDMAAASRAIAFKGRYPSSLFTRTVDDAVSRLQAPRRMQTP